MCVHTCMHMHVHVCEYIHPHTYTHVAVILNVIQPKWPELSNFLFLPKKHLPLGSSQSNDNALKWLWSAEYRCHSHQATPLRSGRTGQKSAMFLFFWNAPRLEGKLLSSYFLSEEMPFQSFYIQHAFLIWGKMSQSKLIWLLDFVQYKQIISIPLLSWECSALNEQQNLNLTFPIKYNSKTTYTTIHVFLLVRKSSFYRVILKLYHRNTCLTSGIYILLEYFPKL